MTMDFIQNNNISEDEMTKMIDNYFTENDIVFESLPNEKQYVDRSLFEGKQDRCCARVWNGGYGGQCSRKQKRNELCQKHQDIIIQQGELWLGYITEKRPENPIYKGPSNDKHMIKKWRN